MTDFPTTMNIWSDDNAAMMEAFRTSDLTPLLSPSPPLPLVSTSTANHAKSLTHLQPPPQDPMALSFRDTLQKRLQALIEAARENWTYAIFWDYPPDGSILYWGDGYYLGEENKDERKLTAAVASSSSLAAEQAHRKKVLLELDSLISGNSEIDDAVLDEEVTDPEWFFLVSMTQSFVIGAGLPGQALFNSFPIWVAGAERLAASQCERARQGQAFGLRTMVCIPTANGVVELGSTGFPRNSILALWELVKQMMSWDDGQDMSSPTSSSPFTMDFIRIPSPPSVNQTNELHMEVWQIDKKTTGVGIEIALEDILRTEQMTFEDAAKNLNVSQSTLKRACQEYGIYRWSPSKKHKLINQYQPNVSLAVFDQEQIPQLNSAAPLPSDHVSATSKTNTVIIKARYEKVTIKFKLSSPWRKIELEQEVKKRLDHLEDGTYYIFYKDEDRELILIACDEDLHDYISSSSHLGSSSIEVFLEQK